jgi:HlyD family secretion protein
MKPKPAFSRRLALLILLCGIVALASWLIRQSLSRKAEQARRQGLSAVATVKAHKGDFLLYFDSTAELESANVIKITPSVGGQIISVAPNGKKVKAGDIVAELNSPNLLQSLKAVDQEQENALAGKDTASRKLLAQVEHAKIQLQQREMEAEDYRKEQAAQLTDQRAQRDRDLAQLALQRQRLETKKRLAEEGLIPKDEIEIAESELKAKEFNIERQTRELELAEARRNSEATGKESGVEHAKASLAQTETSSQSEQQNTAGVLKMIDQQIADFQEQINKATLRAPASGTLIWQQGFTFPIRRSPQPGDTVWESYYMGDIVDLSKMNAILHVPQDKSRDLKIKQPAEVTIPSLPGVKLTGEISEIAQTATPENSDFGIPSGLKTFRTVISLRNEKKISLRPAMETKARIILGKVPNAVSLPLECVFDREGGKIVYVKRNGKFAAVTVELGPQNADAVVIKKGLKGGEEVALRDIAETGAPGEKTAGDNPPETFSEGGQK